jgi:hypothetical protein
MGAGSYCSPGGEHLDTMRVMQVMAGGAGRRYRDAFLRWRDRAGRGRTRAIRRRASQYADPSRAPQSGRRSGTHGRFQQLVELADQARDAPDGGGVPAGYCAILDRPRGQLCRRERRCSGRLVWRLSPAQALSHLHGIPRRHARHAAAPAKPGHRAGAHDARPQFHRAPHGRAGGAQDFTTPEVRRCCSRWRGCTG